MFIVITRHPLAVSYATQKWSKTSISSLVRHWLVCHEYFATDRQFINNLLVIQYEEFVGKPQIVFEKVYNFLGIKGELPDLEVRTGINEKYFSMWRADLTKKLTKRFFETVLIRLLYERRVKAFGYSLNELSQQGH